MSKNLSLKETGQSYDQKLVCSDNPEQIKKIKNNKSFNVKTSSK